MQFYDSKLKKKVEFRPQNTGQNAAQTPANHAAQNQPPTPAKITPHLPVTMYLCGPTVYDEAHLGHAKSSVSFDLLVRVLRAAGYDVRWARNYTDIDDKIIAKMRESGRGLGEITRHYIARYEAHMRELGVGEPTFKPLATEFVAAMVGLISRLMARGAAYVLADGVYFSVASDAGYLSLCGGRGEAGAAAARVAGAAGKRDERDFALWKFDAEWYESPWGRGRPGWHTECVAMIEEIFGGDCGGNLARNGGENSPQNLAQFSPNSNLGENATQTATNSAQNPSQNGEIANKNGETILSNSNFDKIPAQIAANFGENPAENSGNFAQNSAQTPAPRHHFEQRTAERLAQRFSAWQSTHATAKSPNLNLNENPSQNGEIANKNATNFSENSAQNSGENSPQTPAQNGENHARPHAPRDYLIDIHAGGADLLFPHHENEAAQCRTAFGCELARHWLHNGFVQVDGEKMSKSLKNYFSIADALAVAPGEALRFYLLGVHYRANFNYNEADLLASKKRLDKWYRLKKRVGGFGAAGAAAVDFAAVLGGEVDGAGGGGANSNLDGASVANSNLGAVGAGNYDKNAAQNRGANANNATSNPQPDAALRSRVMEFLGDDLNVSGALAAVDDYVAGANAALDVQPKNKALRGQVAASLAWIGAVLGVLASDENEWFCWGVGADERSEIARQIAERAAAKAARDFARADEIRARLAARGIALMDTPGGTLWERVEE